MGLIDKDNLVGSVEKLKQKLEENRYAWIEKVLENRKFYRGEQWTTEQEEKLKQANTTPLQINDYYSAIRDKKGQLIRGKPIITAYPRDNDDVDIANFYRDLISYILYINQYDIIEDKVVTDSLTGGIGWVECLFNPLLNNREGEVELIYQDTIDVLFDPESRMPDYSDAEFVMKVLDLPLDRVVRLFPQAKDDLLAEPPHTPSPSTRETGDYVTNFDDSERAVIREDRIELIELWIKEYGTWAMMQYLGLDPDQMRTDRVRWVEVEKDDDIRAALNDNPDYEVVEIQDHRIKIITVAGGIELQNVYSEYAHNRFPLIPIVGISTETGYPSSQGEQVKEIQKINNTLYSLMVSNLTATNNPITVLAQGLVEKAMIKKIETEGAYPGAVWVAKPPLDQAIQRRPGVGIDASIQLVLQWLDSKIERLFGVRGSLRGEREPGVKSGRMLQMLISQAAGSLTSDALPITASRRELGKLIVSNIQQFYLPTRAIRVVGRDRVSALVNLQSLPTDLRIGKFDIIVGDVTSQPANRLEEFAFLLEINNVLAQQGVPLDYETLIEAAPLSNKELILQRLKEREQRMAQMAIQPRSSGGAVPPMTGSPEMGPTTGGIV